GVPGARLIASGGSSASQAQSSSAPASARPRQVFLRPSGAGNPTDPVQLRQPARQNRGPELQCLPGRPSLAPPPRSPASLPAWKAYCQTAPPKPTRRLDHTPGDLEARARPDAAPALGCAQPAGKPARRIAECAQSGSPAGCRGARASLADSTA